jgi:hypothetical protein
MTATKFKFYTLVLLAYSISVNAYSGSTWNSIYEIIFSDPYQSLPQYKITQKKFGPKGQEEENELKKAARRTLTIKDDLFDFPGNQKLLQANGICFAGEWLIDTETKYTGLLKQGSYFPVIARASVALSGTKFKDKRSFAMAIKIFPSQDRDEIVETVNVFVMETIAGKRRQYFLEAELDNAPKYGGLPALGKLGLGLRLQSDLNAVDRELSPGGPDLTFRPISHLALHSISTAEDVTSPKWLRLRVEEGTKLNKDDDFRDELNLDNFPDNKIIWEIEVADKESRGKSYANWHKIGRLIFNESIASQSCDSKLHFAHPILDEE